MTAARTVLVAAALAWCAGVGRASAQSGVGFRLDLGYQELGRDWGDVLDGGVDGEVSVLYGLRGVRLGGGVTWTSLRVAGADQQSWHHLTAHALLGYGHRVGRWLRPFAEVRYVRRAARPEGARLFDDEAARRPIGPFRSTGDGVGVRLGMEVTVGERTALSVSGERQWFETEPEPVDDLGRIRSGTSWRVGAGLTWFLGRAEPPPAERRLELGGDGAASRHDADPSLGLAVGVGASLGLLAPWTWNEYVKGKPFTPVSPRSWWRGITNGFAWDDNDFHVNYFRHPYHGQIYFNAARANGYGFNRSLLHTVVGSYLWECCTETHIASIPDMVTTVLGGAAWGETVHRMSSSILDDASTGVERVLRETAAGALDPSRGVTRLVTGRAWASPIGGGPGPDRRGRRSSLGMLGGVRHVRDAAEGPKTLPVLGLVWSEGGLFAPGDGPFSYHRLEVALQPGDRATIGRIHVRGALWQGEPAATEGRADRWSTFLDVDYVNTDAYRFASHGVTGGWAMRLPAGDRSDLRLDTEASLVVMGSVDSEYARFAEIRGVPERLRGYDFGVGGGGRLSVSFERDGSSRLAASYRVVHLETLNGSNVSGTRSHHLVHFARASGQHHLGSAWGVRIDAELFLQDSHYGFADFDDAWLRRREARLFLFWRPTVR